MPRRPFNFDVRCSIMTHAETKAMITDLAVRCLDILVKRGFVSVDQINASRWYVELDVNGRLKNEQFSAATSVDSQNRPFLLFNPSAAPKELAFSIPHEVIHLAQICKGDWLPCYGYSVWKGKRIERIEAGNPSYTTAQPWEAEASAIDNDIRGKMYEALPMFK